MAPPPCRSLGRQCRALDVTLRVAAIEGNEDHDGTWFYGHTERIDFKTQFEDDDELWSEATVHVPCKYLALDENGRSGSCKAHGYKGSVPAPRRTTSSRRLGNDRFVLMEKGRLVKRHLPPPAPPKAAPRALPVVSGANPCADAKCHTSDGKRKAACCRDLQVDIRCTPRQTLLESLLRSRKSPYLCKVEREDEELLNAEVISACSFLKEDGIYCDLHGRTRPDGRTAKPTLCFTWPEKRTGLHPGCAFKNRRIPL